MPFVVSVDHASTIVHSSWDGTVDVDELVSYIDEVWREPAVKGYNELIDFREVSGVEVPSEAIAEIAAYSRAFDNPDQNARSAVVAPAGLIYGLSRMFSSMRALEPQDRREFQVFEQHAEAVAWLKQSQTSGEQSLT